MTFWIKHALPRIHWTVYGETGTGIQYLSIWRQWGRRCWNVAHVRLT